MADRCTTCGSTAGPGHIPGPADAVAASICWLARSSGIPTPVSERLTRRRRHPDAGCRYCGMSQAEKLTVIENGRRHAPDDPRWTAFSKATASAQYAKVCEAQEVSWVDSLPA